MRISEGYVSTGDGVRLFFRQIGRGAKPVLIPNGFHMADDFDCLCEDRTLIVYDLRNRGWSDQVSDMSKLSAGIHNDVDDLETVRRHFGISQVDVIGVNRVVQIGPMQPHARKQYPAHLMCADPT
jgi:pimeloyl-ACP methyl ester carboxylesterase